MIAVCCHFDGAEVFKQSPRAAKKILKQWTHLCKAFGIYHLIVVGKNVPANNDTEINVEILDSYSDVKKKYKGEEFVIAIKGGEDLKPFRHHKSCIYVFGSNYGDPPVEEGDRTVGIESMIALHDINAASIILHDRFK